MRGRFEYRVVWQRQGLSRRQKIRGTLKSAERYARMLAGDVPDILPNKDPNDTACCLGYECGCRGETVAHAREEHRQRMKQRYADQPPLVLGPLIYRRKVEEWELSEYWSHREARR